jgi:hypothetical protein
MAEPRRLVTTPRNDEMGLPQTPSSNVSTFERKPTLNKTANPKVGVFWRKLEDHYRRQLGGSHFFSMSLAEEQLHVMEPVLAVGVRVIVPLVFTFSLNVAVIAPVPPVATSTFVTAFPLIVLAAAMPASVLLLGHALKTA